MATISQTYTFVAGAIPTAAQWNSNWTTVVNAINGNLDADNVNTSVVATLATANVWTADQTFNDSVKVTLGTGGDADLYYDGTDVILNTAVVGTGDFVVTGGSIEFDDSEGVTLGTGKDATLRYDGTNVVLTTDAVGTGALVVSNDIRSDTDSTDDLGTTGVRWANVYTDAIGDSGQALTLKATTLTLNGATTVSGTWTDLGTVTTVDINGGTIDGATIGGASAGAGTFTTLAGTTNVVAASDITITSGSIISASGAITFGDENLTTTGTLSAGATTVTSLNASDGNITNVGDIALDSISADGTNVAIVPSSGAVVVGGSASEHSVKLEVHNSRSTAFSASDLTTWADAFIWNTDGTAGSATGIAFMDRTTVTATDVNGGSGIAIIRQSNDYEADMVFITRPNGAVSKEQVRILSTGSVTVGTAALATTATDGFLYIPSCAGTPTGAPTDHNNLSAIVHDTTNNRIYLYDHVSNAWQYAALT
jgi:hypothetical protein